MTDVERCRLEAVYATRGGVLKSNPVNDAAVRWGPDGDVNKLKEWLADETTRQIIDLLRELAFNPPSGLVSMDKLENYGLTSGLQLAVRVVEDPTILFTHAFDKAAPERTASPEADYTRGAYEEDGGQVDE